MKKIVIIMNCLFLHFICNSQVLINRYNSTVISNKGRYGKQELDREVIIPELNQDEILKKWKKDKVRFRNAEPVFVNISPRNQGKWEVIDKEFSLLRIKITGRKATSITVYFDSLQLSANAELILYDELGKVVTGPIKHTENLKEGKKFWGSNAFPGSSVIIELKVPTREIPENKLHVGKIFYGIQKRSNETSARDSVIGPGYGTSSACNVDVSCYSGWAQESRGVALVIDAIGGQYTGSLVMNTCNTTRPFLLTAWHCVQDGAGGWIDPNESTFEFLWISPTCSPTSNTSSSILFNGATGRAKWQQTDFALLELNQNVPAISGLNFLGWTRSTSTPTSTAAIHHPRADIMKIAIDNHTADVGNIYSFTLTAWRSQWDIGTVNVGSSGAPIFNQDHRIVGQLYSNTQPEDPPCNQTTGGTNAGRFDLSWTGGGTNDTRLSNWLDPNNSNAMSTTTTSALSLNKYYLNGSFLTVNGPLVVCGSTANYSIPDIQSSASVTWSVSGPDANGYTLPLQTVCALSQSGQTATLTKLGEGTVRLFATITNCDGTVQYGSAVVTFGVPTIYFNSGFWVNGYYQPIEGTTSFTDSRYPYITLESSFNNSYSWTLDAASPNANYNLSYPPTFASIWFDTPLLPYDYIGFSIQTTNTCGTRSDPVYIYYDGPAEYFRVAPNPVSSSIHIEPLHIKKPARAPLKAELSLTFNRVQVFDKMGNIVLDKKYPANTSSSTIDVSMLKPDIYTLKIYRRDNIESHKIVIQR